MKCHKPGVVCHHSNVIHLLKNVPSACRQYKGLSNNTLSPCCQAVTST